jgi:hypothetical protein
MCLFVKNLPLEIRITFVCGDIVGFGQIFFTFGKGKMSTSTQKQMLIQVSDQESDMCKVTVFTYYKLNNIIILNN